MNTIIVAAKTIVTVKMIVAVKIVIAAAMMNAAAAKKPANAGKKNAAAVTANENLLKRNQISEKTDTKAADIFLRLLR